MGNEDITSLSNHLQGSSIGNEVIQVGMSTSNMSLKWQLPPSKSHAIRALILASQGEKITTISGIGNCGNDVNSMKNCLIQLGVRIDDIDSNGDVIGQEEFDEHSQIVSYRVHGVGKDGFSKPEDTLNVGNSGTALRLIALLCCRFSFSVVIDGDETLRNRDTHVLWDCIKQSGVEVGFMDVKDRLPVSLKGPWFANSTNKIELDVSKSSQPLSAWMLSSSGLNKEIEIVRIGSSVSNRHWELSYAMCNQYGSEIEIDGQKIKLFPCRLQLPDIIEIPKDASMASFAMLASVCLGHDIELIGWPEKKDSIGHEILKLECLNFGLSWVDSKINKSGKPRSIEINIIDCNDLITPLTVMMALGGGGEITGASHASFKESNRIRSTQLLLQSYGMYCTINADGISIKGNQKPSIPANIVDSFGDHRIFMSAYILGCKVGAKIKGKDLHMIADEFFIDRLENQI